MSQLLPDILKEQLHRQALPHAYLFYGSDEAAKESAVHYLLTSVLGDNYKFHPDFYELQKKPISIHDIRALKERAAKTPLVGKKNTFLIRDVEFLSREASPALLKILEEPTLKSLFIATSANFGKILPTVRSRFSSLRFWSKAGGKAETRDIKELENVSYQQRFLKVKKVMEKESFENLLGQGLNCAASLVRKKWSAENIMRLERMLKIKTALSDPTINKRLLCEYFMMVL